MANSVMFKKGTLDQFNASSKDIHVFYLVDETDLYLGSKKITNETDLATAVSRLEVAEGKITTNQTDIKNLQDSLKALTGEGGTGGSISELLTALETKLHGEIQGVQGNVDQVSQDVVDEKERAKGAEATLAGRIDTADGKIAALETTTAGHTATIGQHTSDISGLQTTVEGLVDADTAMDGRMDTVEATIGTLVGEDTGKSVRDVAAEETAKIVAGADEKYDTLVEIADWIKNDTTGAAKMANDIANHETRLGTAEGKLADLEPRVVQNEKDIAQLKTDVDAVEATVGQHANQISALQEADTTNLATAKGYTDAEIVKVNKTISDGLSEAKAARQTLSQAIQANVASIQANTEAIAAINHTTNGILAQAKAYSDANLVTAKGYTDEKLTWQALA